MRPGKLKTKNQYQQQICIYKIRRREIKEKYRRTDEFWKKVKTIDQKIKIWNRAIRRIEKKENTVRKLNSTIIDFLGISVKNSESIKEKNYILARALFYRWGMEHGIQTKILAKYTGNKSPYTLWRVRLRFIRSFPKNTNNKEMWHRFTFYVRNIESENNELQLNLVDNINQKQVA